MRIGCAVVHRSRRAPPCWKSSISDSQSWRESGFNGGGGDGDGSGGLSVMLSGKQTLGRLA